MDKNKEFYTIPQAAKICGVDRTTMWNWVKSGNVEAMVTPGGHHRILRQEIEKLLIKSKGLSESNPDSKLVLIVDDDPMIRVTLKSSLERRNYTVETASDGFQAGLKVLQFKPAVVVLDLYMTGIDGFEVCRTIKTNPELKSIRVIAMSGQDTPENKSRILKAGADSFIAKAGNFSVILGLIDSFFE